MGDLGLVEGLKEHLKRAGFILLMYAAQFMKDAQREVLCAGVRLIRRHLSHPD